MSSSPQHEPTMEEILASIRKIISEDSSEPQPAPAAQTKPPPAPSPAPVEADVLELTQEIHEEAPQPAPMPAPEPAPLPENDVVFETIEEPAVSNPALSNEAVSSVHDGIFSDKTRKAVEETFANIVPEPVASPHAMGAPVSTAQIDAGTVEAVFERAVREAFEPVVDKWLTGNADAIVERMKPLIREWMDERFPAILEGAVREEVARVVQARGTKR